MKSDSLKCREHSFVLLLCTFGWCLICLLQICFSWNGSQQGGIKSGVSLFVWPQMDRNTARYHSPFYTL
uniref:Uncharacterized protein n=1 Tax=Lepeophtheirus salmonis TaxID=72036 RepID=A0A0K2VB52_LEPSM